MTFHAPSEHTFGSSEKRFPLEIQIIHQRIPSSTFGNSKAHKLEADIETEYSSVVLSVFFSGSISESSDFLSNLGFQNSTAGEALKNLLPNDEFQVKNTKLSLKDLLTFEDSKEYVSYEGSLSEPPCTENVLHILLSGTKKLTVE